MRAFFYGFLIGLLIAMGGYIVWNSGEDEKPDPVVESVENIHKLDSLQYCIDELTAREDSSRIVIETRNRIIINQKKDYSKVKTYADSLEAAYYSDKTIEKCDSTITAKNLVIVSQDSIIKNQDVVIDECSNLVGSLSEKVETQDEIIAEKNSTIAELSCAYDWKIKRKFWAWVLGWKCNKK